MAVLVGSARSSYGNTNPGDQNGGREVSTEKYYVHSKGWVVLRTVISATLRRPTATEQESGASRDKQ